MNKVLFDLRKKFTLVIIGITSFLLAIIMAFIYAATYFLNIRYIEVQLNKVLDNNVNMPNDERGENSQIMTISIVNDSIVAIGFEAYEDEDFIKGIMDSAVEKEYGRFEVNDHKFFVINEQKNSEFKYAIYDFTAEASLRKSQMDAMILSYFLAILGITIIAWKLSTHYISPVEKAFDKQKELVANASHELKTPLAVIATNLNVIESSPSSTIEENKKWLDNINSLVDQMDNLVIEMLELSNIDNLENNVVYEPTMLTEIIEGLLLTFEVSYFEKNINVLSHLDENIVIDSNPKTIEKIGTILLDNALKYTTEGGEIRVTLKKLSKHIKLVINNTGEGLEGEQVAKVFERFHTGDASRNKGGISKSFGLGLSIAKGLVESLNGKITCESEVGSYTQFTVLIPY